MNHFISENNARCIGRYTVYRGIHWFGHSGSGVKFLFSGTQLSVCLRGDNTTTGAKTEGLARIGIFMDGIRMVDKMVRKEREVIDLICSDNKEQHLIEILKLSECAMSVFGIEKLMTDNLAEIVPTPIKGRKIEFIGDSITCGYGVDSRDGLEKFQTDTEDVTKTYAFQIAKALDAEYSFVCFSGYGVTSGYTESGIRNERETLPKYYNKIGFSHASPLEELKIADLDWDFKLFEPDLILINLGTNDSTYCKEDPQKVKQFCREYQDFLMDVRLKNPHAFIVCMLGLMQQTLMKSLEELVRDYMEEENDSNISVIELSKQMEEDGYGADMHPSSRSHQKAAKYVLNKMKSMEV